MFGMVAFVVAVLVVVFYYLSSNNAGMYLLFFAVFLKPVWGLIRNCINKNIIYIQINQSGIEYINIVPSTVLWEDVVDIGNAKNDFISIQLRNGVLYQVKHSRIIGLLFKKYVNNLNKISLYVDPMLSSSVHEVEKTLRKYISNNAN